MAQVAQSCNLTAHLLTLTIKFLLKRGSVHKGKSYKRRVNIPMDENAYITVQPGSNEVNTFREVL